MLFKSTLIAYLQYKENAKGVIVGVMRGSFISVKYRAFYCS